MGRYKINVGRERAREGARDGTGSEGGNQTAAVTPEFAALGRDNNQVPFVEIEVLLEPETHERARTKRFKPAPAGRPGAATARSRGSCSGQASIVLGAVAAARNNAEGASGRKAPPEFSETDCQPCISL